MPILGTIKELIKISHMHIAYFECSGGLTAGSGMRRGGSSGTNCFQFRCPGEFEHALRFALKKASASDRNVGKIANN